MKLHYSCDLLCFVVILSRCSSFSRTTATYQHHSPFGLPIVFYSHHSCNRILSIALAFKSCVCGWFFSLNIIAPQTSKTRSRCLPFILCFVCIFLKWKSSAVSESNWCDYNAYMKFIQAKCKWFCIEYAGWIFAHQKKNGENWTKQTKMNQPTTKMLKNSFACFCRNIFRTFQSFC